MEVNLIRTVFDFFRHKKLENAPFLYAEIVDLIEGTQAEKWSRAPDNYYGKVKAVYNTGEVISVVCGGGHECFLCQRCSITIISNKEKLLKMNPKTLKRMLGCTLRYQRSPAVFGHWMYHNQTI